MRLNKRLSLLTISAVLAASGTAVASADQGGTPRDPHCQSPVKATVDLGVFSKLPDLAVADLEGFFAAQGLTVNFTVVPNSGDAFAKLENGTYDLLMASVDNVVNYRLNPSNSLGHTLPVTAIAGNDGAYNLSLWSNGSSYDEVRKAGRNAHLGVDAAASGFAYVAYALLEAQGISRDSYTLDTPGGTGTRYNYLLGARTGPTATLLNQGFDVHASLNGLVELGKVGDIAPQYLGNTVVSLESYLQGDSRCRAVKFIRALQDAAAFTVDPANKDVVIRDIGLTNPLKAKDTAEQAEAYAQKYYAVTTQPGIGQSPDLAVDRKGLATVLQLRARYDGFDDDQNLQVLDTPAGGLFTEDVLHDARH